MPIEVSQEIIENLLKQGIPIVGALALSFFYLLWCQSKYNSNKKETEDKK